MKRHHSKITDRETWLSDAKVLHAALHAVDEVNVECAALAGLWVKVDRDDLLACMDDMIGCVKEQPQNWPFTYKFYLSISGESGNKILYITTNKEEVL